MQVRKLHRLLRLERFERLELLERHLKGAAIVRFVRASNIGDRCMETPPAGIAD
jgi:hypothetical protein